MQESARALAKIQGVTAELDCLTTLHVTTVDDLTNTQKVVTENFPKITKEFVEVSMVTDYNLFVDNTEKFLNRLESMKRTLAEFKRRLN